MNAIERQLHGHPDQLHFDLGGVGFLATGVSDHTHAITSRAVKYHSEGSEIGEHAFSMKLSYLGRSFRVTGNYRREQLRSFDDPDFVRTKIRSFDLTTIEAYRNGRYISELLSKTELVHLRAEVLEVLSSPFYNTTLAASETIH